MMLHKWIEYVMAYLPRLVVDVIDVTDTSVVTVVSGLGVVDG